MLEINCQNLLDLVYHLQGKLYNPKMVVLLGSYETFIRACDVYSEIVCISWNKEANLYVMPEA